MKKIIRLSIVAIFISLTSASQAQWINSITIQPVNPTRTDTITVFAACSFPSAGCSDHTQFLSVAGNDIYASAIHCLGPMTVICNYTDTFKIDPLSAGIYTFHLQVDGGFGPSPCTPGTIPGPEDSVSFVVSPATGITEIKDSEQVLIVPNPVADLFQIKGVEMNMYPLKIEVFTKEGKLVKQVTFREPGEFIHTGELVPGSYQVSVTKNDKSVNYSGFIKQ